MTLDYAQTLSAILRPVAPPRILEQVYSEDQHRRMLKIIHDRGPWKIIMAHHFNSIEELVATTTGQMPQEPGLTLDDFASPNFRGFFAQNGVCFYPELHDVFYNARFLDLAKTYWGTAYAKPTMMLFNIGGPIDSGLAPHLDAASYRGVDYDNTPVWLLNTMAKSGLFQNWAVKKAQVITWWYAGGPGGGFTYWPDGPLAQPKRIPAPMWNRGVVVQNEAMFHRGDAFGPVEQRNPRGVKMRTTLEGDPADESRWLVKTDDQVIATYHTSQLRQLVHWNAELYEDLAELTKVMDHADDLSHDQVFDILVKDMREKGAAFETPSDPMVDQSFIRALIRTYDIAPDLTVSVTDVAA